MILRPQLWFGPDLALHQQSRKTNAASQSPTIRTSVVRTVTCLLSMFFEDYTFKLHRFLYGSQESHLPSTRTVGSQRWMMVEGRNHVMLATMAQKSYLDSL